MYEEKFDVAIVGGGLCGLALAIAFAERGIPYTIYELHPSFTETGAGLNIGPNALAAFDLIEPSLGEAVMALATRNAPNPDVWMNNRLGAATDNFEGGYLIQQIMAPPTGNTTVSRNELLQLLASKIDVANVRFKKKLVKFDQSDFGVAMTFEDGTIGTASILIGCDGIHSTVRKCLLGPDHPGVGPVYTGAGGYRAVLPMETYEKVVGPDIAHQSQNWSGPNGYVIAYPIDGGSRSNISCWHWKPEYRDCDRWVFPKQQKNMLEDFKDWDPTIQRLMDVMGEETSFWASHHHDTKMQPDSYFDGRVCMMGDAAHSMSPHQGQGASQAMEDVYVMAEVLSQIDAKAVSTHLDNQIKAAFAGFEEARKAQVEWIMEMSIDGMTFWGNFWREDLTEADMEERRKHATARFNSIWRVDVGEEGQRARNAMKRMLDQL